MCRNVKPCISCQLLAVSYQRKAIGLSNHCDNSHKAYAIDGGDAVNTLKQSWLLLDLLANGLLVADQLLVYLVDEFVIVLDDALLRCLAMCERLQMIPQLPPDDSSAQS